MSRLVSACPASIQVLHNLLNDTISRRNIHSLLVSSSLPKARSPQHRLWDIYIAQIFPLPTSSDTWPSSLRGLQQLTAMMQTTLRKVKKNRYFTVSTSDNTSVEISKRNARQSASVSGRRRSATHRHQQIHIRANKPDDWMMPHFRARRARHTIL